MCVCARGRAHVALLLLAVGRRGRGRGCCNAACFGLLIFFYSCVSGVPADTSGGGGGTRGDTVHMTAARARAVIMLAFEITYQRVPIEALVKALDVPVVRGRPAAAHARAGDGA
jgi:hypothetical protein